MACCFPVFEAEADPRPQEPVKRKRSESSEDLGTALPSLGVNSVVQINMDEGHPATGTIRWIGHLSKSLQKMAGVELVSVRVVEPGGRPAPGFWVSSLSSNAFSCDQEAEHRMRIRRSELTLWNKVKRWQWGVGESGFWRAEVVCPSGALLAGLTVS